MRFIQIPNQDPTLPISPHLVVAPEATRPWTAGPLRLSYLDNDATLARNLKQAQPSSQLLLERPLSGKILPTTALGPARNLYLAS
ncbi:hypothetical protein PG984_014560 [Apiospora sp. TS-2023a]